MSRRVHGLLLGLLVVLAAAPLRAQPSVWDEVSAEAGALREAGAWDEAIGVVEQFLLRHPQPDATSAEAVSFINQTLWRLESIDRKLPFAQRALGQTANLLYQVWGQHMVARYELEAGGRPGDAARRIQGVLAAVGAQLPEWWYFTAALRGDLVECLAAQGQFAPAQDAIRAAIEQHPRVLTNFDFLRTLATVARQAGVADEERAALALWYGLGDFNEVALNEQVGQIGEALLRLGGPGEALAFVKSQETTAVRNPLRAAPRYAGGDPARAQASLQQPLPDEQRYPQFLLHLYARAWPQALAFCQEELRRSGSNLQWQAGAVAWVARLFKAHDLSVVRANQWLDFQRTGEGENPLPALVAELAAEEGAP